jgi:hypothetical protein
MHAKPANANGGHAREQALEASSAPESSPSPPSAGSNVTAVAECGEGDDERVVSCGE